MSPRKTAIVERLKVDLEKLDFYCQEPDPQAKGAADLVEAMKQFTFWPDSDLLNSIELNVKLLARFERKRAIRPLWEAFQLVNNRIRSPRLVWRVDKLVNRARDRLAEAGPSVLEELSWEEGKDAGNLLRDIERVRRSLSAAKTIDWAQHERVLIRFSPARSVELACDKTTASREVRCYARALELIVDHDNREPLREKAEPLVRWLTEIDHPMAKDLGAFNHKVAFDVMDGKRLADLIRTQKGREAARKRDRRYHQRKDSLPEKRRAVTR